MQVLMVNSTVPDFQKFPILVKPSEAEKNFLAVQEKKLASAGEEVTNNDKAPVAGPDGGPPPPLPAGVGLVPMSSVGGVIQYLPTEKLGNGMPGSDGKLYVGNLDERIGESDLRTILDPFGTIEHAVLHRDEVTGVSKGFAFVTFANPDDCRTAHERISNLGLELMGKKLRVGFAGFPTSTQFSTVGTAGGDPSANWQLDTETGKTGMTLNSGSRAALMAKLAGSAGMALPPAAAAAAAAAVAPNFSGAAAAAAAMAMGGRQPQPQALEVAGTPGATLLIRNMFDPAEETDENWDQDIKEDTEQECSKYGQVLHCYVEAVKPGGLVYLAFADTEGATAAAKNLNGRFFAGRTVTAEYLPAEKYAATTGYTL